jgi:hypothetical protein
MPGEDTRQGNLPYFINLFRITLTLLQSYLLFHLQYFLKLIYLEYIIFQ